MFTFADNWCRFADMRKSLAALAFALLLCGLGYSQTPAKTKCPTISIDVPLPNRGEPVVFSVAVDNNSSKRRLGYKWYVSNGVILLGAGTKSVSVHKENPGSNITATVEITGLPKGCENTISETEPIIEYSIVELIDEFSTATATIDKTRLNEALSRSDQNPNDLLFIVEYFSKNTSDFDIRAKVKLITEYLVDIRKKDANSFTIITEKAGGALTKIYLVPPGAKSPQP